jgi:tetratricopeptide (TPR) repeat protein
MPSNTQIEIALDDYFSGVISRSKLNELMNINNVTDEDSLIDEHRIAIQAIRQYNTLQQVQNIHLQFSQKAMLQNQKPAAKVVQMSRRSFALRIAASVLFILSGYTVFQYFDSSSSKFYQSLHNSYTVTETRSNLSEPRSELVEAYKKGNHTGVITLFAQFNNPGNRELFFAGNAYLETGNAKKAIELFQQILTRNKSTGELLYQDEAEYYLAMAHLKNNDTEKALPLLQGIANEPAHTYHNKINKLSLLKMKWLGHK